MTLRTTSATRRTVVSRSSDVASTSATSSSSDSTGKRSGLDSTEPIVRMIAATFHLKGQEARPKGVPVLSRYLFSRHHANIGEIAILLRVVEPEPNYKFVGNL